MHAATKCRLDPFKKQCTHHEGDLKKYFTAKMGVEGGSEKQADVFILVRLLRKYSRYNAADDQRVETSNFQSSSPVRNL